MYKINKYYLKDSLIHKLNPITKIILLLLMILSCLLSKNIINILIVSIYTILLLLLSKINIKIYLNSLMNIKVLLIFIIIISLIFKINILTIILTIYKIVIVILISTMITLTTPPTEITYGLEKILSPFNKIIKVKEIALIITLALRFIPSTKEQSERIIKAISVRGINYNGSIKNKLSIISILITPMFISSIKKSDQISDIMTVRMYNYSNTRTNYRMNNYQYKDTILLIITTTILILTIIS